MSLRSELHFVQNDRKRVLVGFENTPGWPDPDGKARLDSAYVSICFPRMKTKLTLYVDKAAVKRGKLWARRRKVPLSWVVENHLNRLTAADAGERFLDKWQGAFKLDPTALKDERVAAIVAKHMR
ncbi:DUF6364 family protein [Opitutus sp. GAS368]|uniref:DUF6364 family protein n=1 Tax=Opitutus sp. GAS368 TaxID=1882749 RepID=UPI0015604FD6|nr:DUF6364 family protein [Opitutus sp. GAS368]